MKLRSKPSAHLLLWGPVPNGQQTSTGPRPRVKDPRARGKETLLGEY